MVYKLKIAKQMPTIEEKYEEAFTKYVKEESIKSFVTQQLECFPTLASAWVMIDCKSVHLSSILCRLSIIC